VNADGFVRLVVAGVELVLGILVRRHVVRIVAGARSRDRHPEPVTTASCAAVTTATTACRAALADPRSQPSHGTDMPREPAIPTRQALGSSRE